MPYLSFSLLAQALCVQKQRLHKGGIMENMGTIPRSVIVLKLPQRELLYTKEFMTMMINVLIDKVSIVLIQGFIKVKVLRDIVRAKNWDQVSTACNSIDINDLNHRNTSLLLQLHDPQSSIFIRFVVHVNVPGHKST